MSIKCSFYNDKNTIWRSKPVKCSLNERFSKLNEDFKNENDYEEGKSEKQESENSKDERQQKSTDKCKTEAPKYIVPHLRKYKREFSSDGIPEEKSAGKDGEILLEHLRDLARTKTPLTLLVQKNQQPDVQQQLRKPASLKPKPEISNSSDDSPKCIQADYAEGNGTKQEHIRKLRKSHVHINAMENAFYKHSKLIYTQGNWTKLMKKFQDGQNAQNRLRTLKSELSEIN